jgi:hypothetical protein
VHASRRARHAAADGRADVAGAGHSRGPVPTQPAQAGARQVRLLGRRLGTATVLHGPLGDGATTIPVPCNNDHD